MTRRGSSRAPANASGFGSCSACIDSRRCSAVRAQAQDVPPLPRIAIDVVRSRRRFQRSILAARCRSLIWCAWLAPSAIARSTSGSAAHVARKVPVWLALTAPRAVDGVEPWRAALQGLLARHREGIAILEIEAGADAKLTAFAIRLAVYRSAVCARVDPGRAQWLWRQPSSRLRWPTSTRQSSRHMSICWCCRRRPTAPPHPRISRKWIARHAWRSSPGMPATTPRRPRDESSTASSKRSAPRSPLSPGGPPRLLAAGAADARTDRAAPRRRHHGARRAGSGSGAVACRPRRDRCDATSAAFRQPDLRDLPGLLGRCLASPARGDAHAAGRRRARAVPPC